MSIRRLTRDRATLTSGLGARTSFFFVAQLVTSATNLVFSLALSRALVPAEFGRVALSLTVIFFVVSFQRTVVGDSLLLFVQERAGLLVPARAVCVFLTALAVVPFMLVSRLQPLWVPWYVVVAAGVLVLQDGLRYVAAAQNRSMETLLSDSIWFGGAVVAAWLSISGAGIDQVVSVWLLGGAAALLVLLPAALAAGEGVSLALARRFMSGTRDVSGWVATQYLVGAGAVQIAMVGTALLVGLAAFGGYRAVQLLVAPVMTLVLASASPLMSWMANRREFVWTGRRLFVFSAGFAAVSAVPGVVILRLGDWLLATFPGPAYVPYHDLILPSVVAVVAVAGAIPQSVVLRQAGQGRRFLISGLVGILPGAVLMLLAAWVSGILAAAWVACLQYVVTWAVGTALARRTIRESRDRPTPDSSRANARGFSDTDGGRPPGAASN